MRVLVVDDETAIVDALSWNLRKEGYHVSTAGDAGTCLQEFERNKPDLVILDVMLPSASGFDICRMLRKRSTVPIIMLTARAEETDRVVGLELGADDYVTKPFSIRELMARVKSVLRRTNVGETTPPAGPLEFGGLWMDDTRHEFKVNGTVVNLTPKEFDLLRHFLRHPGQVFTRQVLLDNVWGADAYVEERTVDVHVRWLREKIETDPSNPMKLLTVRGLGYKLNSELRSQE